MTVERVQVSDFNSHKLNVGHLMLGEQRIADLVTACWVGGSFMVLDPYFAGPPSFRCQSQRPL
jgi:hypothetical protein